MWDIVISNPIMLFLNITIPGSALERLAHAAVRIAGCRGQGPAVAFFVASLSRVIPRLYHKYVTFL
jgi:hypothetical protein